MFVPELWNVYYRTLEGADRTNNYAESAHRKLQRAFSCSPPTLWKFTDILKREQKARDADMALFIAGHNPPQKARKYRCRSENFSINPNLSASECWKSIFFEQNQIFHYQPIIDFLARISNNCEMDT